MLEKASIGWHSRCKEEKTSEADERNHCLSLHSNILGSYSQCTIFPDGVFPDGVGNVVIPFECVNR